MAFHNHCQLAAYFVNVRVEEGKLEEPNGLRGGNRT